MVFNFFKKKKEETITTSLDLLPTIIQKNFEERIRQMEMDSAKEISKLRFSFEKARNILKKIKEKEIIEKENKKLNKAALTSKNQVEKQLDKVLEKINPKNVGNELDEIKAYSFESYNLLISEINFFRKNIVYTSIFLKDEMKELGETLQEILNCFNELKNFFEKEKDVFEFEKTKKRINELKEIKAEKEKIIFQEKQIKEEIKQQKKNEDDLLKKIEQLKNSEQAKELQNFEEVKSKILSEKQKLKTEISSMISTIDRPLQRFNALVESGRWKIDKEQIVLLNNFITNPLLALKKDINGEKFKEILKEIVKAIDDGKIELKEKEKEKRLDALRELINFNFFESVFWKLNEIQKDQVEIENQLKNNSLNFEIQNKQNDLNEINKSIQNLSNELVSKENQIKKISEKEIEEKDKIIIFAKKATGKNIVLVDE